RNEVVEISEERPRLSIGSDFLREVFVEEGEAFGNVYSRGFQRNDEGQVLVDQDNGLPLVTGGKTVMVANYEPDWTGGISSNIAYGNWNLSFLIDHRQGGNVASFSNAVSYADGVDVQTLPGREGDLVFGETVFKDESAVMVDSNGDEVGPNTATTDAESFWRQLGGRNAPVGEAFVESATNTRLRELTLGYRLPESVLATLPVSNVTVSLVGRNLFFIHRASANIDPDLMLGTGAAAPGFESFAPPTTRTFGANIKVDF
ncbi:MAG: SusC/RagA family TonB-linked outer membrane protein, partial [Bacteroidota bacterium]